MGPLAFIGPVLGIVSDVLRGDAFAGTIQSVIRAVADGEMSADQANARIAEAQAEAEAEMTKALAASASEIFASAQETIRASFQSDDPMVRRAWAFVVWSQTGVLLWYQIGLPFWIYFFGGSFPRTGDDLLMWAYALVGGALGLAGLGAIKGVGVNLLKKRQ
ncbi:3TM-type holin [Breoghania sp.]|uniref:3TM-type holin n=1 Tax=Breoghania sp. TaxID=2065378 RepID=UPI0029CA4068|nr:3TM-type holin [Breoghania sp.]